jgi:CubicO group peptidase (beta-lactamase class C family)
MTKSVTQALAGIAVQDKTITLDEPMGHPLWPAGDPRAAITFRHALTMTDGLRWREIGARSPTENDAARLLYGPGRLDVSAWAASRPREHAPGAFWRYSTGSSHLVAAALQRRIGSYGRADIGGRQKFFDFMQTRLFRLIGMTSAAPEFDLRGTYYGGSLLWATPQDWARFGLLYLRDGVWDGQRLLPDGWVDFARTKSPAVNVDAYGASWWISPQGAGLPGPDSRSFPVARSRHRPPWAERRRGLVRAWRLDCADRQGLPRPRLTPERTPKRAKPVDGAGKAPFQLAPAEAAH